MRRILYPKAIRVLLILIAALIAVMADGGITKLRADDDPDELLNYAFAVWVGSGFYKVSRVNKRFAVLRVPAAYTLRPSQYEKVKFRDKLGWRLLLPAVAAFQEETGTNFEFEAAAFVPGLEMQIPVNSYWTLKPFAQFGLGKDTSGGDLTYIYGGGARSLISIPWKKFVFGIGNSIILAENRNSTENQKEGFSMLEAGLDVRHPLGLSLWNRELDIGVFFVVSRFFNKVEFLEDLGDTERINRIYTAGLTIGSGDAVSIWKIDVDRVGIDYRWGNKGFRGIGFYLGFPF